MNDLYYRIVDYFIAYDWSRFLFLARTISGVISLGLLVAVVVILKKIAPYNHPRRVLVPEGAKQSIPKIIKEPWQAVLKKLESENPADWSIAVIQADSIVDTILKEMGLPGETMGERIKTLDSSRLASLDDLWEAHRIRNEIAHSPEKTLTKHRAVYAISLYEKVLKEFGYIE